MKRILFSMLAIFLVIGLVVGTGALAYFSDTETSTGNTFNAGTLELKIWGAAGWGDVGPVAEWSMSNMVPGAATDIGRANLSHTGTISAHHLEVTCDYTATELPPTGDMDMVDTTGNAGDAAADDFAKYVEIIHFDYHNGIGWRIQYNKGVGYEKFAGPPEPSGMVDADWQIADVNHDGIISLYDLKLDPLDNLPPPGLGVGEVAFEMRVRFHEDAGNDLQGDTLNATINFTLNQDSSQ